MQYLVLLKTKWDVFMKLNSIFIGLLLFANYASADDSKNFHKITIDEYQEMTFQMT